MGRAFAGLLAALVVTALARPSTAYGQQDLLDNLMLLGRAETLRLPGVEPRQATAGAEGAGLHSRCARASSGADSRHIRRKRPRLRSARLS